MFDILGYKATKSPHILDGFNAISTRIPPKFLVEPDELIPKYIWKSEGRIRGLAARKPQEGRGAWACRYSCGISRTRATEGSQRDLTNMESVCHGRALGSGRTIYARGAVPVAY